MKPSDKATNLLLAISSLTLLTASCLAGFYGWKAFALTIMAYVPVFGILTGIILHYMGKGE